MRKKSARALNRSIATPKKSQRRQLHQFGNCFTEPRIQQLADARRRSSSALPQNQSPPQAPV